ncbi:MAG TPA: TlpA disulfide reductase family protein [Burkholderiales bacterium]|nr:TlpA disulfide reductase family protein [Burkholderiales bacterium]
MFSSFAVVVAALLISMSAAPALAESVLQPWDGTPAPALVLKDIAGRSHDLTQYRGNVVLVNFWATWCEPCRHEMASIQTLKERLAGKPFVALAVNVDEPEARVRNFVAQTRLALPVLVDTNKTVTRAWGVRVLPATYIIGPDGRMRYRLLGDMDWNNDATIGLLSQLMGGG